MPSASSLLKRLKKEIEKKTPIDEALSSAQDYLGGRVDAARRDLPNLLSGERFGVGPIPAGVVSLRDVYQNVVDPVKELGAIAFEEQLDPLRVARRVQEAARTPARPGEERTSLLGGLLEDAPTAPLGRSWRNRDDSFAKFATDLVVDPTIVGSLATAPGKTIGRTALQVALREIAAPIGGAYAGQQIGEAVGDEEGARLGRSVGALAGGFGPNLVSGQRVQEASERVARTVGTGQPAPALGIARMPAGARAQPPKDTIRLYHGTGSAFDAPDAARFDANGLYGPGYYLTSDPRVAASYGDARTALASDQIAGLERTLANERKNLTADWAQSPEMQAQLQRSVSDLESRIASLSPAPNIRPVDVPRDLRFLDAEVPSERAAIRKIENQIRAYAKQEAADNYDPSTPSIFARQERQLIDDTIGRFRYALQQPDQRYAAGTNASVYEAVTYVVGQEEATRLLSRAGYDGIRYSGGQRIPLKDDAGKAIEHDAYVIFPESLPKITNALSGTPGGLMPAESAADLARLRSDAAITPQMRPQGKLTDAEIERMLDQFKAMPRQSVREALELNWTGVLRDIFGTATPPKTLTDWRRLLTSGGAAQGAAANVLVGAAQGETDPDQILENALMGAGMGVTARRARSLGAATGMPGAKGPVLGVATGGAPSAPGTIGVTAKARAAARAQHAADLKETRSSILDLPRQVLVAGDVGQPLRIGIGGEIAAISAGKGFAGLGAFGRALRAAVSPGYFEELMKQPEYAKWKGSPLLKDFDRNQENLSIIQRIPGLGAVETALFQRFTPAFAAGVANAVSAGMKNAGDFRHMSDTQRNAVVGDWVKGLVIGRELSDPEVGHVAKAISRFALASRWTAGGITAVSKIADPGAQGELARRFWGTAALMGVATSVGLTAALTQKNPADLLNPLHPDSVVDPRNGRRFLAVELPGGTLVSPLQPILPLARALLRPLVEGADTYAETQSVTEAVNALLGEGIDSGRDYMLGKAAPVWRIANDVIVRQADWQGKPIVTKDWETNPLGAFAQAALYAATQNVPIFLQPVAEPLAGRIGIPGGTLERDARLPGTEPSMRDRLTELGLGFIGVQTRTPDRLPPDAAQALRGVLRSRGVEPGADGDLTRQYSALDLDPSEKASIERANPAIKEFFTARQQLWGEKYEKPAGRARVDEYMAKQGRAKAARDAALVELEREQLPGDEYRRRRRLIYDRYAGVVDGLGEAIFETSDPVELQKARDAVYRKQGDKSPEEKALEGLYAIRQTDDSIEARDAYFAERDAYLNNLPADLRAKIDQAQLDRAPTETERQYILAQREMQEYYAIPTYVGMTVEESRTANRTIQRARDRQVYEPWLKLKTLVLLDDSVSSDDQINAYMAIGGKLSNPARRQWFMSRPHLAKFFSSLPQEEAALLAA